LGESGGPGGEVVVGGGVGDGEGGEGFGQLFGVGEELGFREEMEEV
jgi:hypothetical protein